MEKVVIPAAKPDKPKREFGFVHFTERDSAVKAVNAAEKPAIDGKTLDVRILKLFLGCCDWAVEQIKYVYS